MIIDRQELMEVYDTLEMDWNMGGWLQDRPSNRRRMESTYTQLLRMGYKRPRWLCYDSLNDDQLRHYHVLVERWDLHGLRANRSKVLMLEAQVKRWKTEANRLHMQNAGLVMELLLHGESVEGKIPELFVYKLTTSVGLMTKPEPIGHFLFIADAQQHAFQHYAGLSVARRHELEWKQSFNTSWRCTSPTAGQFVFYNIFPINLLQENVDAQ